MNIEVTPGTLALDSLGKPTFGSDNPVILNAFGAAYAHACMSLYTPVGR